MAHPQPKNTNNALNSKSLNLKPNTPKPLNPTPP